MGRVQEQVSQRDRSGARNDVLWSQRIARHLLVLASIGFGCTEPNPNLDGTEGSTSTSSPGSSEGASATTMEATGASGPTDSSGDGAEMSSGSTTSVDTSGTTATDDTTQDTSGDDTDRTCVADGNVGVLEACDDANEIADDGCSSCEVDVGYSCDGEPSDCRLVCDPLVPTCAADEGCYPIHGPTWVCTSDASGAGGAQGNTCDAPETCDPGLTCIEPTAVAGCDAEQSGCCTAVCDVDAPVCPPDGACVYVGPPAEADVGVCRWDG